MGILLREGKIDIGLNPSIKFSNILISSRTRTNELVTVVGCPEIIESKINKSNKKLLRG